MGFKKNKKYYIVVVEYDPVSGTETTTKTKVDEDTVNKILHPLPDYCGDRRRYDDFDAPNDDRIYNPRRETKWGG